MATQTFTVQAGSFVSDATKSARTASFIVESGSCVLPNFVGALTGNDSARTKNWLPPVREPIGYFTDANGQKQDIFISDQWYRFFDELAQRRLGGVNGAAITDVQANVETVQASVTDTASLVTDVAQQTQASQIALLSTKAVLIHAGVQGASSIPAY
jgi:hypothetical protein